MCLYGTFGKPVVVCALILCASVLSCPEAGYCAHIFHFASAGLLGIAPDPRGQALGEACSAIAEGVSCAYWDPAGLAFAPAIEVANQGLAIDDTDWFGTHTSFDGALVSLGSLRRGPDLGTVCVWRALTTSGPPEWDSEYHIDCGTRDLVVGLAYAHRLGSHVAVGLGYKWAQEQHLCTTSGSGNGFDLGIVFRQHLDLADAQLDLRAAGGVRNLGSYEYRDGSSNDLPRLSYIGIAPTFRAVRLWDWLFEVTVSGEVAFDDVMDRQQNMCGVEVVLLDGLAARLGTWTSVHWDHRDSRGLGLAARYGTDVGLAVDYSRTEFEELGNVERYMLTLGLLTCSRGLNLMALLNR
jgi:hypothetical protein